MPNTKRTNGPGAKPSYRAKRSGSRLIREATPPGVKSSGPNPTDRLMAAIRSRLLGEPIRFEVGDRVQVINPNKDGTWRVYDLEGRQGIVKAGDDHMVIKEQVLGIEFDNPPLRLHSCSGKCAEGKGWWLPARYLRLVSIHSNKIEGTSE